ncbi:MAG: FAD-dependent oxidoreductase [Crocinitomicaceae bacterium]|jgi:NAD(P)H-nitrite reductase large subunit|tara:strand:- start:1469 stop:2797 length:1329 start_codon:yes stop_codon:yes gene_type:complete
MIIIIGNGISGVTAARNIRKRSADPITIISAESKYFFSRTALMYVYMGHMKFEHIQPYENHFWEDNKIDLLHAKVDSIDTSSNSITMENGDQFSYSKLILATGSKPNKFGWKGQDAKRVGGLYSKQDLEYAEKYSVGLKTAVIIGGGLIGIELAEMFLSRSIKVHFLVREKYFWNGVLPNQDSSFIMDHISKHHGLIMHYENELDEIMTNENNEAIAIKTKLGETIECQFVGLTAGVSPNISLLKSSGIETNRGIMINCHFETSAKDVYAIGDCAEFRDPVPGRRPIEQVWYTGKIMGELIAKNVTGERCEYTPGQWFNSAKFFDIEYQTYGNVLSTLPEGQEEFVYKHDKNEILLHFVFEKESRKFIGINNFGIRMRHLVFNEWLITDATIEDVLLDLKSANFDPEFHTKYEDDMIKQFNAKFNTQLVSNKPKWWQNILAK